MARVEGLGHRGYGTGVRVKGRGEKRNSLVSCFKNADSLSRLSYIFWRGMRLGYIKTTLLGHGCQSSFHVGMQEEGNAIYF
jgi:hypothetical protein